MRRLAGDLRYAGRTLRRAPVFTAVAVVSLALGIGANTAIFTLLDQALLRLLPVKDPEQLVLLTWQGSHYGSNTGSNALSYPMYRDFRDQNQVFSGMLCRFATPLALGYEGSTERVAGELISGNYFEVLGVKPAIGRLIGADDDRTPGGHPVAVLSYDFWQQRFGGDPKIVGRTIHLNSFPTTVIGVSQAGFLGIDIANGQHLQVPMAMKKLMTPTWDELEDRRRRFVQVFGRLKPGVTLEQAKAGLQPIFKAMLRMEVEQAAFARATAYSKEQFLRATIDVLPGAQGRPQFRELLKAPLLVLMAIVGLVLLIACANLANLLLARAVGRQREIAVRLALGATRARLVRQLLVESVLLSMLGGAVGLGVAYWTNRLLLTMAPGETARLAISANPDLRVFGFALAVSVLTGILFGLAPGLQATRPDLAATLKEQAGSVAGAASPRLRKALVAGQVALSLVLLIGAGLFVRSLWNLRNLDPGFRAQRLVSFTVDPPLNGYKTEQTKAFYGRLQERLEALPGVESTSLAVVRILDGNRWDSTITVEGYEAKPGEDMNPWMNYVRRCYFKTMGIPVLAGREFTAADEASKVRYAVVNERFAKHYYGGRAAVGRRLGMGGNPGTRTDIEIIGVVKDTKYRNLRAEIPRQVFLCQPQEPGVAGMTVYARTSLHPDQVFTSIRRAVRELDANLPVFGLRTIEKQIDQSLVLERLVAMLSAVFGVLATALAAMGLYGVMAYAVARRTREIGIRMALGASPGSVVGMVMREVLVLVAAGAAVGLPAAYGLSRLVEAQLYGITSNDPLSLAAATAGLAAVALLAGYLPARRAATVDPMRALRYE